MARWRAKQRVRKAHPSIVVDLRPGETVLDLGSGGGIDVLSAARVGPTGHVYGLDRTPEMLTLARRNAAEAGATNVEFLEGEIELDHRTNTVGEGVHSAIEPHRQQTAR